MLGGAAGLFGGPLGSFVGGVMGWSLGLGTAWLLEVPGKIAQPRATAAITYPDNTASVTVTFHRETSDSPTAPQNVEVISESR